MKLSLPTVLTLIFLVLKLTHVVSWSWWLVFLPTIIQVVLISVLFVSLVIMAALETPEQRLERRLREFSKKVGRG